MKAVASMHQNWKEHCVDAVLITMVVGSVVGLAFAFLHH